MEKVRVFGAWPSPFSMRVKIALQMKGVEFEYVEEDLQNKSDELIKYNPIHKKIPVLVLDGKAIPESLVILEYIDEAWKDVPILPSDPYERAQARFWAKFVDDKVLTQMRAAFIGEGEDSEKALKELEEHLKILESEIKGKKFLGGNSIGYADIVASIVPIWIPCWQQVTGKVVLTRDKYPCLCAWGDELLECSAIKQHLPDNDKLQAFYVALFASLNAKATK